MYKLGKYMLTEPEFIAFVACVSFAGFLVLTCVIYYLSTLEYMVYLLERERWERERSERQQRLQNQRPSPTQTVPMAQAHAVNVNAVHENL
jgi:hypothetical protein